MLRFDGLVDRVSVQNPTACFTMCNVYVGWFLILFSHTDGATHA